METLHIKIEADEAINSKKTLLSTEINLLNMIKKMQDYNNTRNLELKKKASLKARLKELELMMKKLKVNLPKTKTTTKKEELREDIEKSSSNNLELELRKIQARLANLA